MMGGAVDLEHDQLPEGRESEVCTVCGLCTWAGLHHASSCVSKWRRTRRATYTFPTTGPLLWYLYRGGGVRPSPRQLCGTWSSSLQGLCGDCWPPCHTPVVTVLPAPLNHGPLTGVPALCDGPRCARCTWPSPSCELPNGALGHHDDGPGWLLQEPSLDLCGSRPAGGWWVWSLCCPHQ